MLLLLMVLMFFLFILSKKAVPLLSVPEWATPPRYDEESQRRLARLRLDALSARDELARLDERLAEARARAFERARMTPADARLRPRPAADTPLRMHPYKALRMGYELARGLQLL
nr:MAG: MC089L [Molluscum contagiosum virus]